MNHFTEHLTNKSSDKLFCQRWLPESNPVAVVGIIHGIGEHSDRYANLVQEFIPKKLAVFSFDHRGHGRSPGQRGHINSWDDYASDVQVLLDRIRMDYPDTPLFLYGHSLGALIVLDFLIRKQPDIAGSIISAAPIDPQGVAKPVLILLARIMSVFYPRFVINIGLERAALSRSKEIVQAYQDDPLVHGKATARWGSESLKTLQRVIENVEHLCIPLLFIHGDGDRINSARGVSTFFDKVNVADKTLVIYPGRYHELHNDIGYERVALDTADWILKRSKTESENPGV